MPPQWVSLLLLLLLLLATTTTVRANLRGSNSECNCNPTECPFGCARDPVDAAQACRCLTLKNGHAVLQDPTTGRITVDMGHYVAPPLPAQVPPPILPPLEVLQPPPVQVTPPPPPPPPPRGPPQTPPVAAPVSPPLPRGTVHCGLSGPGLTQDVLPHVYDLYLDCTQRPTPFNLTQAFMAGSDPRMSIGTCASRHWESTSPTVLELVPGSSTVLLLAPHEDTCLLQPFEANITLANSLCGMPRVKCAVAPIVRVHWQPRPADVTAKFTNAANWMQSLGERYVECDQTWCNGQWNASGAPWMNIDTTSPTSELPEVFLPCGRSLEADVSVVYTHPPTALLEATRQAMIVAQRRPRPAMSNSPNDTAPTSRDGNPLCHRTPLTGTWTIRDRCHGRAIGNVSAVSDSLQQTFYPVDRIPPRFERFPDDRVISCSNAAPYGADSRLQTMNALDIPIVRDSCDPSPQVRMTSQTGAMENGTYRHVRSWTAIDQCGNEAVHRQSILVQDRDAPRLGPATIRVCAWPAHRGAFAIRGIDLLVNRLIKREACDQESAAAVLRSGPCQRGPADMFPSNALTGPYPPCFVDDNIVYASARPTATGVPWEFDVGVVLADAAGNVGRGTVTVVVPNSASAAESACAKSMTTAKLAVRADVVDELRDLSIPQVDERTALLSVHDIMDTTLAMLSDYTEAFDYTGDGAAMEGPVLQELLDDYVFGANHKNYPADVAAMKDAAQVLTGVRRSPWEVPAPIQPNRNPRNPGVNTRSVG